MSAQSNVGAGGGGRMGPVARLWAQLSTNRRAAGGLIAAFALLAFYGLFAFDDLNESKRIAYRQLVAQTRRALAASEEKDWLSRAKESTEILDAFEKRMWRFESEGVALANLQDWVTAAGRDAGLGKVQVKIDLARPKELGADRIQLTATITASQNEEALRKFLEKIEREPHLLVIDELHVLQRPPSLQMTLLTYAKVPAPSGGASK